MLCVLIFHFKHDKMNFDMQNTHSIKEEIQMKKTLGLVMVCIMLAAMFAVPAGAEGYVGVWVCVKIEQPDGSVIESSPAIDLSEIMSLTLQDDGIAVYNIMGGTQQFPWSEAENGIALGSGENSIVFEYQDGCLLMGSPELGMLYLSRESETYESTAQSTVDLSVYTFSGDYAGQWECVAIDLGNGVPVDNFMGISVTDVMQFEIFADGTMTATAMMGLSVEGTWETTDGGVILTLEGDPATFTLEGSVIKGDIGDGVIAYMAQK